MLLENSQYPSSGPLRGSEPEGPAECVRRARQAASRGQLSAAVAFYERALSIHARKASLWRDDPIWELRFAGEALVLGNTKGVQYLSRLVRQPGRPVPALLLAAPEESRVLAAAYERLHELEGSLSAAEDDQDVGRARGVGAALARHREQIDTLVARTRRSPAAESARVRVTQALRSTIARIAREHSTLGAHLQATIRTGTACTYAADPVAQSISWDVRP